MANHVLYIGLGGTGVYTIAHIRKLYWEAARHGTPTYKADFLYADTDSEMQKRLRASFLQEFNLDETFIDFEHDWIDLGGFNPNRLWATIKAGQAPSSEDIRSWMNPEGADRFESKILTIGADARRQLGRLCFVHNLEPIRTSLTTKLDRWKGVGVKELQIVIASSSCGGTGSSAFFDFCYLASVLGAERIGALPQLRPIIVSPQGYVESVRSMQGGTELVQRMKANAYAFFLELQHARSGKGPQQELFAAPSSEHVKAFTDNWKPFQAGMVFDVQVEGTTGFLNLMQLPQVIGEMVYHLHSASGDAKIEEVFTNMDTSVDQYFLTLGMKALNYPSQEITKYLCSRLAYELVVGRFLAVGASEKELNEEASKLEKGSTKPFEDAKNHKWLPLGDPGVKKATDIGGFFKADTREDEIDPATVTKEQLGTWHDDLRKEIEATKAILRGEFQSWAGTPTGVGGQYGACRALLQDAMESAIESWGVSSWVGWRTDAEQPGLARRFAERMETRAKDAHDRLLKSSKTVAQLEGDIQTRCGELIVLSPKLGILAGVTGKKKELLARLESLAGVRKKLFEEQLQNEILKREVEFLRYVGARAAVIAEDYFLHKKSGAARSIVAELLDHGLRIKDWLGNANTALRTRLDSIVESLSKSSEFVLFDPPLSSSIAGYGASPSGAAGKALQVLLGLAAKETAALKRYSGKSWGEVRKADIEDSGDVLAAYEAGIAEWILDQLKDPNQGALSVIGQRTLENHLNGLSAARRNELAKAMSRDGVRVFCPVGPSVSKSKPFLRMVVTADDGNRPEGAAQMLGYVPADKTQAHLRDDGKPHRAVAIKLYHQLSLQDFPWMETLRSSYESLLDYEPHLWRDGRVRLALGVESAERLQRAFALSVLWASVLGRKWNGEFASYFTGQLVSQPDEFLHSGPIALRSDKALLILRGDLEALAKEPGAVNPTDARVRIPVAKVRYEKLADPQAFHVAYAGFMKSKESLRNAEWFHRHFAGIRETWIDGTLSIEVTNQVRAERFMSEARQFFSEGLIPIREALENAVVQDAVRDKKVVTGQMINALKTEVEKIQQALSGTLI